MQSRDQRGEFLLLYVLELVNKHGESRTSALRRAPRYLCAMLLRPAYLSQNLDRPLPTKDGGTLHTIGQVVEYMTSMGKKRELRTDGQRRAN
jgi:hypothetical protein